MKKALLTAVFVFSLVLNAAVGATVAWHIWRHDGSLFGRDPLKQAMPEKEFTHMNRMWAKNMRQSMMEHRQKVIEKNLEILDLIAKDPGNPQPANKAVEELIALRGEAERNAIAMMSKVMASLPEEKRESFLLFMKNRACMGRGLGPGKGKWRHRMPGDGCPPGMGPP